MGRPLLFLDVDGVLNPFGPHCPAGFTEHALFPGEEPGLITTEPAVGLTRAHVRQALGWARRLTACQAGTNDPPS